VEEGDFLPNKEIGTAENGARAETADDDAPAAEAKDVVKFDGEILDSKQAILDFLKMGEKMFNVLHKKYPFINAIGITGKVRGKFFVSAEQVRVWAAHVQHQETRHPEMRRFRPEEPPDIGAIKGR
jgi:hypothetical protein